MIVVIGSGIAGLSACLRLAAAGRARDVTLVTKGALLDSNTEKAQGGIAVALGSEDSPALHAIDTVRAGAGLNGARAVARVCTDGPSLVRRLVDVYRVPFDRDPEGVLERGLEAAHTLPRVLHAGGDATGHWIAVTLAEAVRSSGVRILEGADVTDLVVEGGQIRGVRIVESVDHAERAGSAGAGGVDSVGVGPSRVIPAEAMLLATGGIGRLFEATTNPVVATGDGVALAFRAGAVLRDLEFVQFHPTALAVGDHFLVSEAVRGEGAVLLDERGRRFMRDLHPDAELAPRDVVARGIARTQAAQGGRPVLLDATGLGGAAFLARRFPTIDRRVREAGFAWDREPIPVAPAAHYFMGGVAVDVDGRTSLPGLYAAGEVACSGLHGANRLASNSLLEGLVYGVRAAEALLGGGGVWPTRSGDEVEPVVFSDVELSGTGDSVSSSSSSSSSSTSSSPSPSDPASLLTLLRHTMQTRVGVERDAAGLAEAKRTLSRLALAGAAAGVAAGATGAADATEAGLRQVRSMATVGWLIADSAEARTESRGAHWRRDFPGMLLGRPRHRSVCGVAAPTAPVVSSAPAAPATSAVGDALGAAAASAASPVQSRPERLAAPTRKDTAHSC